MKDQFLKRQEETGAVLNTDLTGLEAYRTKKRLAQQQQQRINNLENKVDKISEDLGKIMNILLGKAND